MASYIHESADWPAFPWDRLELERLVVLRHRQGVDRPAVEAGPSVLDAGGDFADGAIAHDGRWLGGDTFVSFDKKAVKLLVSQGHAEAL